MKIWSSEHTFEHPWETVVKAAWRKYPNPFKPEVEGVDVVDRHIDDKGVLRTHRLMSTRWGIPSWAVKILGQDDHGYGSEHSKVDPAKKKMTLNSRNLTFCSLITIDEKLVYSQHPEDKSKTILSQQTEVNVKGIPLSSYLENIVTDSIEANATKGRQAMEHVIEKIKSEATELQHGAVHAMDSAFNIDSTAL